MKVIHGQILHLLLSKNPGFSFENLSKIGAYLITYDITNFQNPELSKIVRITKVTFGIIFQLLGCEEPGSEVKNIRTFSPNLILRFWPPWLLKKIRTLMSLEKSYRCSLGGEPIKMLSTHDIRAPKNAAKCLATKQPSHIYLSLFFGILDDMNF